MSGYPLNLTPGESISITIGAAGQPGNYPGGTPGGTTSFGGYLSCTGGGNGLIPGVLEVWDTPGSCGASDGVGAWGSYAVSPGGGFNGGLSSLYYGSGGIVFRCNGCALPNPTIGYPGKQGVVIVDVLY